MNRFHFLGALSLLIIPSVTYAQTVQVMAGALIGFLMSIAVPFLLAVAFLFFVVNVIRYFIIETDDVSKRANAKNLALYGVMAFVIILIFFGLVSLFIDFIGLGGADPITPDYIKNM